MLSLILKTGDITEKRMVKFSSSFSDSNIYINLNDYLASINKDEWNYFCNQISEHKLKKWQSDLELPNPIGNKDIKNLIRTIRSTPSYQLFLSSFDISRIIGLGFVNNENLIIEYSKSILSNYYSGRKNLAGLYFLKFPIFYEESIIENLIKNNKLCSIMLYRDDIEVFKNYYVPYSTPTSNAELNKEDKEIWQEINEDRANARQF